MNINKSEKFIKKWKEDRQEGKEKYVNKTSMQSGMLILVTTSISSLYRGEFGFFYLPALIIYFLVGYIPGRVGAKRAWKKNESKYHKLMNEESDY